MSARNARSLGSTHQAACSELELNSNNADNNRIFIVFPFDIVGILDQMES